VTAGGVHYPGTKISKAYSQKQELVLFNMGVAMVFMKEGGYDDGKKESFKGFGEEEVWGFGALLRRRTQFWEEGEVEHAMIAQRYSEVYRHDI